MTRILRITKYWMILLFAFTMALQAQWAFPANLIFPSTPGLDASDPQIAVDSNGNAIDVFVYNNGLTVGIFASTFKKATMSFSSPILISPADEAGAVPQIGVDPAGNGVAIWVSGGNKGFAIDAAQYNFATDTWSGVTELQTGLVKEPQIAVDPAGNAVAVWITTTVLGIDTVFSSTYDFATSSWSSPVPVSVSITDNSFTPQVGVDMNGNAVAVWRFFDGSSFVIQSSSYDFNAATWTLPITISSLGLNTLDPQVAVASNGNAVAIWSIFDGTADNIQSASYDGAVWSAPSAFLISPSVGGQDAAIPQIGVDANGNATAVWRYFDGTANIIETSNFDFNSQTWSPIVNLTSPVIAGQDADSPQIAVTPVGNAVAIWTYFDGVAAEAQSSYYHSSTNTWFNRFNITRTSVSGRDAAVPQIGVDPYGNAAATWERPDGSAVNIQLSVLNVTDPNVATVVADPTQVFSNGTSISTITVTLLDHYGQPVEGNDVSLSQNGSSVISPPSGPSDGNGRVIFTVTNVNSELVTYSAVDETGQVNIVQQAQVLFATSFPPEPPSQFKGEFVKNKFLNETKLVNVLTWLPSPDADVRGYRLFQNGKLIHTFSAAGPFKFVVPNVHKHRVYVYTLVAFDADGLESTPVQVVIRT